MEWSSWLSIAVLCATGAASPGPSLAVVAKNTIAGGRRQGILCASGHGLGVGIYAFGAVAGFSALVATTPSLHRSIEVAGALALLGMGIQCLRRAGGATPGDKSGAPGQRASAPRQGFGEGFLVSFLNPKIAVFFLALLSSFVPAEASLSERAGVACMAMIIDGCWYTFAAAALVGTGAADWLGQNGQWVDRVMGGLLLGAGIALLALG